MKTIGGYFLYMFVAMGMLMSGFMALGGKADADTAVMLSIMTLSVYFIFTAFVWFIVGHRKHRLHIKTWMVVYAIMMTGIMFTVNRGGPFLLVTSIVSLAIIWFKLLKTERKNPDEIEGGGEILRGTSIADNRDIMHEKSAKNADENSIKIGGVSIPKDAEASHFLFAGGPGTGKSVAISAMLETVRKRGERAIVYDPTGEFLAQFYKDGDVILNPLDARSALWTPWSDASDRADFEQLAEAIIPPDEKQPFFPQSARAILVSLLETTQSVTELTRMIMGADSAELLNIVTKKGMAGLAGSGQTFANSRASMTAPTTCLRYLKNAGNDAFSIKKWVADDKGSGWLFLTSRADQRTVLRPLLTLWLDIAVTGVMMLKPDRARRIWLFVDELPSLQKMPKISTAQAECRKYGLCTVTGIQSVAQLRETYGRDGAEALLGLPQTQTILRLPDPDTAKWASGAIGERHIVRRIENESASGSGGSTGTSQQHATEAAILPSQIQNLPNLEGLLKYPAQAGVTVTRIKLAVKDRPELTDSYVPVKNAASVPTAEVQNA